MARGVIEGVGGKRYKTNQITGLAATVGWATANTVKLTWTNPTDVNFKGLVIRYKAGSYPTGPTDGYSFYDSNDAAPVATYTVTGANIVDGTTFYFRAFAYSYIGATKVFNTSTTGAQASGTPYRNQGIQVFTASGSFTVPYGVNAVDVFLVGGGAGGAAIDVNWNSGGGGGGGFVKTVKSIPVVAGSTISAIVGAGGIGWSSAVNWGYGSAGGVSSAVIGGNTYASPSGDNQSLGARRGGNGGSGGGAGGMNQQRQDLSTAYPDYYSYDIRGGAGGSNGGDGGQYDGFTRPVPSQKGTGLTTKSFEESSGTLYSGGGGGGVGGYTYAITYSAAPGGAGGGGAGGMWVPNTNTLIPPISGASNTGGGGGGAGIGMVGGSYPRYDGANGGSGIVIIRWGY